MTLFTQTLVFLFFTAFPVNAGQVTKTHATEWVRNSSLKFESVFENYQPYRHQSVAPWSQSNKRVGEAGGRRAYAREAAEQDNLEAPSPSAETLPPVLVHGSTP